MPRVERISGISAFFGITAAHPQTNGASRRNNPSLTSIYDRDRHGNLSRDGILLFDEHWNKIHEYLEQTTEELINGLQTALYDTYPKDLKGIVARRISPQAWSLKDALYIASRSEVLRLKIENRIAAETRLSAQHRKEAKGLNLLTYKLITENAGGVIFNGSKPLSNKSIQQRVWKRYHSYSVALETKDCQLVGRDDYQNHIETLTKYLKQQQKPETINVQQHQSHEPQARRPDACSPFPDR